MPHLGFVRAAVVGAFALAFAAAAQLGALRYVEARNQTALDEMSETALRYVELAVVSARNVLNDLAKDGAVDCGDVALQSVRLRVYEHSVIKDIRILTPDGMVRCSAYAETLEFDRDWPTRTDMLATVDGAVRLFRVQQFTQDALGVFKDVDSTKSLAAIVAIDPLQLDLLPASLRAQGRVSLELANGEEVATSAALATPATDDATVARVSAIYPLRINVTVSRAALYAWNGIRPLPLLGGSGLLGTFFGLLVARLLRRPLDAAHALDVAIRAREFRPYYQPIFGLADRRILGCEVLMRWVLADGRVLAPSAFIPLAESTGRIEAMTWQMLTIALTELQGLIGQDPCFKVSFNVVPRHFLSPDFMAELGKVVAETCATPPQLVLELTERDELEDLDRAKEAIGKLRAGGFRLALDDVGVGHSGLSHIQSLRPDTLKVDKFFTDALGFDMTANVVVDMLVRLAQELGMSVVAEGVETEAQVAALTACGVSEGQGYLLSPPVPLPAFLSLVGQASDVSHAAA